MSDCACLYGGYDECGPSPLQVTRVRTARKEHHCHECRRAITKGQRYEHYVGKDDDAGGIFTVKTCLPCADIRKSLYCDGYYFGQLWEDIEEQFFREGGLSIACIDKLATIEAKQFMQQRWIEFVEER